MVSPQAARMDIATFTHVTMQKKTVYIIKDFLLLSGLATPNSLAHCLIRGYQGF